VQDVTQPTETSGYKKDWHVPSPEFFWDTLNTKSKQILENSGNTVVFGYTL